MPRKGILKRPGTLGGSVRRTADKDDTSQEIRAVSPSRVRLTEGGESLNSPTNPDSQIDNERSDRLTPLRDSVSHAGNGVGYFVASTAAGNRPKTNATAEWIKNTQLNSLVARQQQSIASDKSSLVAGGARKLYKHRSHSIESDSEHHLHYTGINPPSAEKPNAVKVKYSSSLRETRSSEQSSDG